MFNHYWQTTKHKAWVAWFLLRFSFSFIWRAVTHDLSKYGWVEAPLFARVLPRLAESTYGSDEYRATLKEIGPAIKHHNTNNRHHPEHFGELGIRGMNLVDLVEMFCDWNAAVKRHNDGDITRSIKKNADRFNYDLDLQQILLNSR